MANRLNDRFMQRQIEFGEWIELDGPAGMEYIPADIATLPDRGEFAEETEYLAAALDSVRDYSENREIYSAKLIRGYGARLSAPGYMDCTEWTVFSSKRKALDYLREIDD